LKQNKGSGQGDQFAFALKGDKTDRQEANEVAPLVDGLKWLT